MNSNYGYLYFILFLSCASGNAKSIDKEFEKGIEKEIEKPLKLSNVSYSSVVKLAFKSADFKLAYGKDPLQYGLLWLPPKATSVDSSHTTEIISRGDFPLIILVHGGCWLNAYDIKHTYALSTALAAAGYAVWSLEYRRTGDEGGGWPGSLKDVLAGIAYVNKLKDYPIDLSNIVLTGHSAGGHLALLAGAKNQKLQAVIGLAAISDVQRYSLGGNSCQSVISQFMGGGYEEKASEYDKANPIKQTLHARTQLLQGGEDVIVPVIQASGSNIPFNIVNGAGHFDWIHPQTQAFEVLLVSLQDIFKQ